MDQVIEKVIIGVASTLTLALLSLVFERVRDAVRYRRVEYEFLYTKGMGPVSWDIQWEKYRLTIHTVDVSNDGLDNVKFTRDKRSPMNERELVPSDKFKPLFEGEIQVKLDSIVRRKQENTKIYDYLLRFVFRRPRWKALQP